MVLATAALDAAVFFCIALGVGGEYSGNSPGRPTVRFFDSTIAILSTQILGLISVFFVNLLISRHFGEAGKGYVSLLIFLAEVLYAISNLALGFSGQYFAGKKLAPPRKLYSNFVVFSLGSGLLAVALFALTHSWWRGYLQSLELRQLAPALLIAVALMLYEPCTQLLIAIGRIGKRNAVVLTQNYLLLGALAVGIALGVTESREVIWMYAGSYCVAVILVLVVTTRELGTPNQPSLSLFKSTMKYGGWIHAANLFGYLYGRIDFFMLTALTRIETAGVYSVATGLTSPLLMLAIAVHTVFYPKTSSESDAAAAITTPFYYRQALLVQTAGAIALAIFARPVLSWYGPGFVIGLPAMLILLVAAIVRGMSGILALHILGRGKSYTKALAVLCSLATATVLNLFLIPRFEMIGAALATTCAALTEHLILMYLYHSLVGGEVSDLFRFKRSDLTVSVKEGISLLKRLISRD